MSLPLLPKSDQHPSPFSQAKLALFSSSFFQPLLLKKYRQILITSVSHPDYSHLCEITVSFQSALAIFHPPHNLHLHLLNPTNRILPPRRYPPSSYFSTPKGTHTSCYQSIPLPTFEVGTFVIIISFIYFFFFLLLLHPPLLSSLSQTVPRGESETRKRKKKKGKKKKSTYRCDKTRKRKKREKTASHPARGYFCLCSLNLRLRPPRPAKPFLVLQLDIPRLAAKSSRTADILTIPVVLQYNRHSPPPRRFNFSGSS